MAKVWYELEVQDFIKTEDIQCDVCLGEGELSDGAFGVGRTEKCIKCDGTGEIQVRVWNVVAKVKSPGLANLIVVELQKHYKGRVRVKR